MTPMERAAEVLYSTVPMKKLDEVGGVPLKPIIAAYLKAAAEDLPLLQQIASRDTVGLSESLHALAREVAT